MKFMWPYVTRRLYRRALRGVDALLRPAGERPAGFFVTHVDNDRIRRHFDRLVAESGTEVDWRFALNPWSASDILEGRSDLAVGDLGRHRYRGLAGRQSILDHVDLLMVALGRSVSARHVWIMEFDVDYSGNWGDFFRQFADVPHDLLGTTIVGRANDGDWYHWRGARTPSWLPVSWQMRGFFPIVRFSRRLLRAYERECHRDRWDGHSEFLIPTAAQLLGFSIGDIGASGPWTVPSLRGRNYTSTVGEGPAEQATFRYRPVRDRYFHEEPSGFELPDMLYHPVKPNVSYVN